MSSSQVTILATLFYFFFGRSVAVVVLSLLLSQSSGVNAVMVKSLRGGYCRGETPDPIPNSAVKPSRADDTATGGKVGRRHDFYFY